jgi:aminocarboxymuconate-semialdehyde decarboxylase
LKIDTHNHALPQAVQDLVSGVARFGVTIQDGYVKRANYADHKLYPELHDVGAKLAQLEQRGLEGAIICIEPSLFSYHLDLDLGEGMAEAANRGLRTMAEESDGRFRWMAHVPLQDPQRAAQVLESAAAEGAVGVEVGSSIAGRRLDEPDFEPFWRAVETTGVTVFVHNAYNSKIAGLEGYYLGNVIGNLLETTICVERLVASGTLDRHPKARVLLGHAGGFFPYQAGRLRHARTVRPELAASPADPWDYAGQLIFDTITHDVRTLAFLVSRAGADNVVMGTDMPYDMSTPQPMRELVDAVGEEVATQIAETNPERYFS